MVLKFYKTTSPTNKLDKSLSGNLELVGNLKNDCDIMRPRIEVSYFTDWKNYNYVYIPEFGRYYYIDDVTFSNGKLSISMSVDVLMSFKSEIRNSVVVANRSNHKNNSIMDNMVSTVNKTNLSYRKLGSGVPTTEEGFYIMSTASGTTAI